MTPDMPAREHRVGSPSPDRYREAQTANQKNQPTANLMTDNFEQC